MNDHTRTLHVERSTSTAHRLSRYDGVCGNIHGHNMHWVAEVVVDMSDTGDDNMPLDLKHISDLIDETDHATLLSEQETRKLHEVMGTDNVPSDDEDKKEIIEALFGDVIWFEGDPTCEVMAQWMANRIREIDEVISVQITVHETDKYGIETSSGPT